MCVSGEGGGVILLTSDGAYTSALQYRLLVVTHLTIAQESLWMQRISTFYFARHLVMVRWLGSHLDIGSHLMARQL